MSALSETMSPRQAPIQAIAQRRGRRPIPPKTGLQARAPWREPMSRRQVDALFVRDVMPGLTAALEREFADWFESDREEAAQDCVCLDLAGEVTPEIARQSLRRLYAMLQEAVNAEIRDCARYRLELPESQAPDRDQPPARRWEGSARRTGQ